MANITLYLPDSTYRKMKKYNELKWSELVRQDIEHRLKTLEEVGYRLYSLKRLAKEGSDAHELFDF